VDDFPLTPVEAIAAYWVITTRADKMREGAETAERLTSIANKLKVWGDANAPSDIGPNVIQADVTHNPWIIACDGGISHAPNMSARSREIWRETGDLLAKRSDTTPGERQGYVGGPIILDETQDWPSGVGGCGQTTIVRGFGDDMLGEPTVYLCKPCATENTDDDEVWP